jgi:hypothetical protein
MSTITIQFPGDVEDAADYVEQVAAQIRDGFTSGYVGLGAGWDSEAEPPASSPGWVAPTGGVGNAKRHWFAKGHREPCECGSWVGHPSGLKPDPEPLDGLDSKGCAYARDKAILAVA